MIRECAVTKCGNSDAALQGAVARGAVKVTNRNNIEFYHFPEVNSGETQSTSHKKDVHGKKVALTPEVAAEAMELMTSYGWGFTDDQVAQIGDITCDDEENGDKISQACEEKLIETSTDFAKIFKMAEGIAGKVHGNDGLSGSGKSVVQNLQKELQRSSTVRNSVSFAAKHHTLTTGEVLPIAKANTLLEEAALAMKALFEAAKTTRPLIKQIKQ